MFVGHSLFAFAAVALVASRAFDVDSRRALALGAIAGAFAAVPDADMAYALSGVLEVLLATGSESAAWLGSDAGGVEGAFAVTGAFWAASTVVHRSMTHSVVVAPVAAGAFALFAHRGPRVRLAAAIGGIVLVALVLLAAVLHGVLGAFVLGAFAAAGAGVAYVVRERTTLGARGTFALALVGLATHPFGDLFTGEPPALLWPLDTTVLDARVALANDPTLHLLGAFALELAVVALALLVYADLAGHRVRPAPWSVAGVAYGAAVLVLPAPTLDVSYQFVFSILALGVVATTPTLAPPVRDRLDEFGRRAFLPDGGGDRELLGNRDVAVVRAFVFGRGVDAERFLAALATGVATVALALAAYAVGYTLLG